MAFLQTTLKSGYITDLILPRPLEGQTPDEVLKAGLDAIFASVHTPNTMITLNPLVHEVKQLSPSDPKAVDVMSVAPIFGLAVDAPYAVLRDGENPALGGFQQFEILDKLNVMFGYTTDLTYFSAIRATKMGMEALTNAGSGVVIYGRWEIKVSGSPGGEGTSGGGQVINLIERNEIKTNVLLSWYIKASLDKSHRETHRRLKEKWLSAMRDAGYKS
ncbi:hypothetical protein LTR84_006988 [Exophiala bonariae]|uniref:DUF7053 domain-containing protein n=1 Tax=Exophiala bonariae TaxID=1690606 RepID=A0AAV9MZC5_9EURO|nr:hypothetical protein LTR84_006988 [Exophiala bonariae]